MNNNTFKKRPKRAALFMILLLGIMYGCDQLSNPTSSLELENSEMEVSQILSEVSGSETRITTSGTATHINPAIDGHRIVWQDDRNSHYDIYLYDLFTGSESRITNDPNNQTEPAIDGMKIVWSDGRSMDASDIFMYNLATSSESRISNTPEPYNDIKPEISGNRIIWETFRWDIYAYNLSSGDTQTVGFFSAPKTGYDISGNLVVFSEYDGLTQNIRLYNFESDSYISISSDTNYDSINPSIDGNRIVWQDNRNGNYDIYFYDLSTDTESQITSNTSDQTHPVISGNYIVWVDNRDGNENIFYYDLVNKTEYQVTDNSASQINPDISGNRIVWQDNRDGNWNIYFYEIETKKSSPSGFINGSGFIHSPLGAVVNDGSKSGRANFRLNARIKKGGELQGRAAFSFNYGNLDFQSTSFNQIIVSGNTAKVSGTGMVNGSGEYKFFICVVDEKSTGRNRVADKYRLRIVDTATQEVVYDNQMGDSEEAKATYPITNGKILVKADN
jgi:TolB protein